MNVTLPELIDHLLLLVHQVQRDLGFESHPVTAEMPLSEALDSMGLVELLGQIADDCMVKMEAIEQAVGRRYTTIAELAQALLAAGILPCDTQLPSLDHGQQVRPGYFPCWLAGTVVRLPAKQQSANELDSLLQRPRGWLTRHAGIYQRGIWAEEDVVEEATEAIRACLRKADVSLTAVGALLVSSIAPPIYPGLAAALHHRLHLPVSTPALEIGGGCTGFLASAWAAQRLLQTAEAVLMVSIEAPSRWLQTRPGSAGEAAALFGDAIAVALFTVRPTGPDSVAFGNISLGSDGSGASLLQAALTSAGLELEMQGSILVQRAIEALDTALGELLCRARISARDLVGIVVHAGNGRMAGVLARHLNLPESKVWSQTAWTGNLGSASLPAAWNARGAIHEPVAWLAVGAGLQWGAVLSGDLVSIARPAPSAGKAQTRL